MVFRGELAGRAVTARVTDRALTVGVGNHEVIAWDRAGRLYSVWNAGRTCRRGLSGRGLVKWHDDSGRHREWMSQSALDALIDQAAIRASDVAALITGITDKTGTQSRRAASDLRTSLGRASRFTSSAATADARRFLEIYGEIGMLPPDQYLAMVVQLTEGCSFGTCAFCDLYKQPFRVRTPAEFSSHVTEVLAYLGESVSLRNRSVFLGAANAIGLPTERLVSALNLIVESCGEKAPPVCAFGDAFLGDRKTGDEYGAMARAGLRRVYVGLESGHDPLLVLVEKPSGSAEAIRAVRAMKAGGLSVGVIVLVGLGGGVFAERHVDDTVSVLNGMPLGKGDLVYFSDLVEQPGGRYDAVARRASIRSLTAAERVDQRRRMQAGLRFADAVPPLLATYDVREFVY